MEAAEKKKIIWVVLASFICILEFFAYRHLEEKLDFGHKDITVGLIVDGDESTPYSENFIRAMNTMKSEFGDDIDILIRCNVPYEDVEEVLRELADKKCDIIFTNSYGYGETVKEIAKEYPGIQFCQATCDNADKNIVSNYHTFMGEIYEGRYIAGMVAGLKLTELIDSGEIIPEEAWIGYVGAYPYPEVISGYTAFFLGARQTCPSVRMRVKYTNTWTSYMLEKEIAGELIDEGCIIISQHSDTIGPAVMCENAVTDHPVFHVGYNQDMIDVAPTTSLIGTRVNWTPYIRDAIRATMNGRKIEEVIRGNVHGNDIGAGFDKGWVEMLELNPAIAPEGGQELINRSIEDMKNGRIHVFRGDYIGYNPTDPSDSWDLRTEYHENSESSAPTFKYILQDVIIVE